MFCADHIFDADAYCSGKDFLAVWRSSGKFACDNVSDLSGNIIQIQIFPLKSQKFCSHSASVIVALDSALGKISEPVIKVIYGFFGQELAYCNNCHTFSRFTILHKRNVSSGGINHNIAFLKSDPVIFESAELHIRIGCLSFLNEILTSWGCPVAHNDFFNFRQCRKYHLHAGVSRDPCPDNGKASGILTGQILCVNAADGAGPEISNQCAIHYAFGKSCFRIVKNDRAYGRRDAVFFLIVVIYRNDFYTGHITVLHIWRHGVYVPVVIRIARQDQFAWVNGISKWKLNKSLLCKFQCFLNSNKLSHLIAA